MLMYTKKNFYLKKFFYSKITSFKNLKHYNLTDFDYIINCSIHPNYTRNKYNKNFDIDLKICQKILNNKTKYIFLFELCYPKYFSLAPVLITHNLYYFDSYFITTFDYRLYPTRLMSVFFNPV